MRNFIKKDLKRVIKRPTKIVFLNGKDKQKKFNNSLFSPNNYFDLKSIVLSHV